jgi:acetyltransferase-like isoleucine patch superfamily enzyme
MRLSRVRDRLRATIKGNEYAARLAGVRIGTGCRILSRITNSEPWLVEIGDRVTISSNVTFITHDGSGWLFGDEDGRRYRYAPISIGNDVFVGHGVTILPGVRIDDRVVIGAGSVVTRSVPSGSIVAGVPARRLSDWDTFMSRVAAWPAAASMRGTTYRERVDSIVEDAIAPYLR